MQRSLPGQSTSVRQRPAERMVLGGAEPKEPAEVHPQEARRAEPWAREPTEGLLQEAPARQPPVGWGPWHRQPLRGQYRLWPGQEPWIPSEPPDRYLRAGRAK